MPSWVWELVKIGVSLLGGYLLKTGVDWSREKRQLGRERRDALKPLMAIGTDVVTQARQLRETFRAIDSSVEQLVAYFEARNLSLQTELPKLQNALVRAVCLPTRSYTAWYGLSSALIEFNRVDREISAAVPLGDPILAVDILEYQTCLSHLIESGDQAIRLSLPFVE